MAMPMGNGDGSQFDDNSGDDGDDDGGQMAQIFAEEVAAVLTAALPDIIDTVLARTGMDLEPEDETGNGNGAGNGASPSAPSRAVSTEAAFRSLFGQ